MELKLKLETLLHALDNYDDIEEYGLYLNIITGELYNLYDSFVNDEENDQFYEEIINTPDKYLKLPDQRSIEKTESETEIMKKFVLNYVDDEKKQKQLLKSIKGTLFSKDPVLIRFSKELYNVGLKQEYDKYISTYCEDYVRDWCKKHNIIVI